MQYRGWTHKIACLGLAALMALTAGAGLASSAAGTTENAWSHGEALHAGRLALVPVELDGLLSLSPDGTRALAWRDGAPVVISLADGAVTTFWNAAEGIPSEIAESAQVSPEETDLKRTSWSCDGRYLAFALPAPDGELTRNCLLWMADLALGTIAPLQDVRISTPESPSYFTGVHSVAFHPSLPVLYFVASAETLLSRMNPFSAGERHTMVYHYSYESDAVTMMESVTGLLPQYLSPVLCDGGTLAMLTVGEGDATLLALAPMHAIARKALGGASDAASRPNISAKLADLQGNTALLVTFVQEDGSGVRINDPLPEPSSSTLTTVSLPELLPLEEPEDPELPVVPKKSDFGEPRALDIEGLMPQAAAFSPAGECVAALGMQEGKLAMSIIELDSGKAGAVDLSALNLPEDEQVLDLWWAGSDRMLIRTAGGMMLCALSEK